MSSNVNEDAPKNGVDEEHNPETPFSFKDGIDGEAAASSGAAPLTLAREEAPEELLSEAEPIPLVQKEAHDQADLNDARAEKDETKYKDRLAEIKDYLRAPALQERKVLEAKVKRRPSRTKTENITIGNDIVFHVDVPDDLQEDALDDEFFLQAQDVLEEVPVYYNIRKATHHPLKCFAIMCSLWFASLLFLIILSITVGSIEFDIGVPFYDRSEVNQNREDAYLATERDADHLQTLSFNDPTASSSSGGQTCVNTDPTIMTRNGTLLKAPMPSATCQRATTQAFRILYVSSDRKSNILTSENLKRIQEIETEFLSALHLSRYCNLQATNFSAFTTRDQDEILKTITASTGAKEENYHSCKRITSVLNFMDELYYDYVDDTALGYHLIPSDLFPQEYDLSQDNIDFVVDYWSNYTSKVFNLSSYPVAVATIGEQIVIPNLFYQVVSTDFTPGSTAAIGVMSEYSLGVPINGYASASQGLEDQQSEAGEWLWEEFDSFFKSASASFDGVDILFSDTEGAMQNTEEGALAILSFSLFPLSLLFVWLYLMYMLDSIFIACIGIAQILLAFIPGLVLYRYVFGVTYLGVLNIIAVYIILGIGVDDIFVFCDQWQHQRGASDRFDQRMQKTFKIASKAMFTTSCTTFISFISNATSVFPAVSTFGLFAALLVLVNFCAVTFFFPSAYAIYFRYIRPLWWDHPSRLICFNSEPFTSDILESDGMTFRKNSPVTSNTNEDSIPKAKGEVVDEAEEKLQGDESDEGQGTDKVVLQSDRNAHDQNKDRAAGGLVGFFRDTWAPLIVKLRYVIVLLFVGIFIVAIVITMQLEPDEEPPNTLPNDNNYRKYSEALLDHFARAGNPTAITILWVGGINPDNPIDRIGTDETNTTDYGVANYVDCATFDPSTTASQVWNLLTIHDMFFGNVTEYHGGRKEFGPEGSYGPFERRIVSESVPRNEYEYYQYVVSPHQGFRDWLLTDYGCSKLKNVSLPCYNETRQREGCTLWDPNGNSCEPYPVPSNYYGDLFYEFLFDESADASTRLTNYDKYANQLFVAETAQFEEERAQKIIKGDFDCRLADGNDLVVLAMSTSASLDQGFAINYEDGIDLYNKWEEWSIQMREYAPKEIVGTMQTSEGEWAYYFLNETLLAETFRSIGLALILAFVVLSLVGGNPIMAAFSVGTIILIVADVFAFTVLIGWKLGVLEAVNYVVVIGLSIDYCVHMSEAYTESHSRERIPRVIGMVEEMGVSVLSGALSTLGAAFFMFFAPNIFFVKFASFIFVTICLSCIYALVFFPAILAIIGPTGDMGNVGFWIMSRYRDWKHRVCVAYMETEEFKRREYARKYKRLSI